MFWKPVYYVLEQLTQPLRVLLRASFVPPRPIRELRDLTRYRRTLIAERQRGTNRLHKVLEDAGIKLVCVATDLLGVSWRAMLTAMLDGNQDPVALAAMAKAGRTTQRLATTER